jgi:hypothetical protein
MFDLDETLVYVQGKDIYVRPYSDSVLWILSRVKSNILILWSSADSTYVYNVIVRLNWSQYFKKILTREDCDVSLKLYGENKSCLYIRNILKEEDEIYSIKYIMIDDLADENDKNNYYDFKIQIVPYKTTKPGPDLHLYNAVKCFI